MTAVLSSDLSTILAHAANSSKGGGGGASLSDIIAAVWIERLKLLDAEIASAQSAMLNKNTYIFNLEIALRELRINCPKGPKDTVNVGKITAVGHDGKVFKVVSYIDDGLFPGAVNDGVWNQAQFTQAIEWLSAKLNLVRQESQIDLIRMQNLLEKKNQSFQQYTDMMKRFSKSVNDTMLNR